MLATNDLDEHLSRAAFDSLVVLVALDLLLHDKGPPSRLEMGLMIGTASPHREGARAGINSCSPLAPMPLARHSGVDMDDPNRADELRKLLVTSFSADEFRRFVRFGPDGETLAPELPSDIASLAQLAAAAVELFERVHLVTDPAFWRRLVKERERRAAEIERVRALYMTAGMPAMPPLQAPADLHDALGVIGFFRELARLFDVQRVMNMMHRAGLDPSNSRRFTPRHRRPGGKPLPGRFDKGR
ncbi:hypothetical protein [Nannocystis pusilla]|uniref:hypothetical protein n=1 Tax=Nannocystis pusilla TaxID=889268 RepID=UPI003B813F5D